jgi:hypothetical protein
MDLPVAQRQVQSLNRLINVGVALESDGHRVDEAAFDGVLDGLLAIFGVGEIAVAAELRGDGAPPFGAHRLYNLRRPALLFIVRFKNALLFRLLSNSAPLGTCSRRDSTPFIRS